MSDYEGAPEDFYKQALWIINKFGPISPDELYRRMFERLDELNPQGGVTYMPRDLDMLPHQLKGEGFVGIDDTGIWLVADYGDTVRMLDVAREKYRVEQEQRDKEREAEERLRDAAPKLLAACKAIIAGQSGVYDPTQLGELIEASGVKAAIAEAESP